MSPPRGSGSRASNNHRRREKERRKQQLECHEIAYAVQDHTPVFCHGFIDHSAPEKWNWNQRSPHHQTHSNRKLKACEQSTYSQPELRGEEDKNNSPIPFTEICQEARSRLESVLNIHIEMDKRFTLWHLQASGHQRIWGLVDIDGAFHIIWWDPSHLVQPRDDSLAHPAGNIGSSDAAGQPPESATQ